MARPATEYSLLQDVSDVLFAQETKGGRKKQKNKKTMTSIKHDKDLLKGNALSFAGLERVAVLQRDKQKANKQEWTMNQKLKQKTKNKNRPGQEQRILLCRT